jgi:hypothetical protein
MPYNFPIYLNLAGPPSEQSMNMIKWCDVRDIRTNRISLAYSDAPLGS